MDADRQYMLSEYIATLYRRHLTYDKCGKYIMYVAAFLEKSESISRSGWLKYRKSNIVDVSDNHIAAMSEAICDFLSFRGIGYKTYSRKLRPLQKLSKVSDRNKCLLNSFLDRIIADFDYSPNTIASYRFAVTQFFEYSNDFNSENIRRYIQTLSDSGKSPATIRLRITALEQFAIFVKKTIDIKRPKIKKTLSLDNIPTEKEYIKLLNYLRTLSNKKYYLWIKILATSGVRRSEFAKLTWADVIAGEALINGKGNKYRRVFFPKELSAQVAEFVNEDDRKKLVYLNPRTNVAYSENCLPLHLREWGVACGISRKKMHPHAFRHLFAKMFLKKKNDIVQLADLMGHGSIETTRIYLQRSYAEQKRDFNRNVTW